MNVTVAAAPPATLIARGATWRFLDTGASLDGVDWRVAAYDDATWRAGAAELGCGDGDERTVVVGGPSSSRHVTTYFRHEMQVANPAAYSNLTVRVRRDDGAVVYLNGTEVSRTNMPGGSITSATLASRATTDEATYFAKTFPATALVAGTNIVAVEIHQSSRTSSDISFDLELVRAP